MVRVSIKGGIWKNSEDEILKAAVQKYGKQQWARVASLLNRKTAKQAKARWHEWLDPSIRKTPDWSREEEEKLLHLAKLLPAQWKTIGPLVGHRTATQCQEHYEYLLDQAASGSSDTDHGDLRKTDSSAAAMAHPETKPARPDSVTMDEDEMEMLQEARARLANTQGKKAKRKERERMLASAKRLADLQKRRELKAAGLLSQKARTKASRRNRDIDLGVEIPFHKPAPAGLHDVSGEDAKAESIRRKRWKTVDYNQINEQQYKSRDREAAQLQKREQARLRMLQQSNDQYAAAAAKKTQQDADKDAPPRPRGALQLPAPGISDQDRRDHEKQVQFQLQGGPQGGGDGVTAALMGDYSGRPLPTPLRSAAPVKPVDLVQTATQLRQLQEGQTPLLPSGAEVEEEESTDAQEDSKPAATRTAAAATPLVTRRDELGLNDNDGTASVATFATDLRSLARQERRAAKRARQELTAALAALPAPQFEYELAAPKVETVEDEDANDSSRGRRDRADIEAEERASKRARNELALERRSTVVKRTDLPRPPVDGNVVEAADQEEEWQVQAKQELEALLLRDQREHPVPLKKNKKNKGQAQTKKKSHLKPAPLLEIPQTYLDEAKDAVMKEMGDAAFPDPSLHESFVGVTKASQEGARDMIYVAEKGWVETKNDEDRIQSLKLEFETLQNTCQELRAKNDKMVKKSRVVHAGYEKRAQKLHSQLMEAHTQFQSAEIEELVFARLAEQEHQGAESRLQQLSASVASLKQQEAALQKRYGSLSLEKRRLALLAKPNVNSNNAATAH